VYGIHGRPVQNGTLNTISPSSSGSLENHKDEVSRSRVEDPCPMVSWAS